MKMVETFSWVLSIITICICFRESFCVRDTVVNPQWRNNKTFCVRVIENGRSLDRFAQMNELETDKTSVAAVYVQNVEGWNDLTLSSSQIDSKISVDAYLEIMRAAGAAEGLVACTELAQTYTNFYADNFGRELPPIEVIQFLIDNLDWLNNQAELNPGDRYWVTVRGAIESLLGIVQGFWSSSCLSSGEKHVAPRINNAEDLRVLLQSLKQIQLKDLLPALKAEENKLTLLHLLMMNAWGDLYTISTKYLLQDRNRSSSNWIDSDSGILSHRPFYPHSEYIERDLRCSSLFKLLPDFSEILFGHAVWGSYIAMGPRIFKHTFLPTIDSLEGQLLTVSQRETHFSSAPGLLASLDDFYVIASTNASPTKLVVIETTNDLMNPKLYDLVTPGSSLCWLRALLANSLAADGGEWTTFFATHASGTYTNQWQVADLNKFTPGQKPAPGFFHVLEEVPGTVVAKDLTEELVSAGYWGSYNIPYFPEISAKSGYLEGCKLRQRLFNDSSACWETAPRANIFRARQGDVQSLADFQWLINYNDWQHDPLSQGDPCNAIACRRDLEPRLRDKYPSGSMDAKVSSFASFDTYLKNKNNQKNTSTSFVFARVGPTTDQQPVFCWSQLPREYVHAGQPDCFNFQWVALPVQ